MLSASDPIRIAKIALFQLGGQALAVPKENEREPSYTARVLMPVMDEVLTELKIDGLTLHGDGKSTAPGIALPSAIFNPDIALLYRRERLVAFEVKFLRRSGRQASLAAAIGQAAMYGAHGYKSVGTILLDMKPQPSEAALIRTVVAGLGMQSCIFKKSGTKLISALD